VTRALDSHTVNDWLLGLQAQPAPITAADYETLAEDISRAIEIVDGYVVFRESRSPDHQQATRRLADLLEVSAKRAIPRRRGGLDVSHQIDLRLRDVPLLNRQPDVVIYQCLDHDVRLRPEHVLLIAEVTSPGSATTDTIDKLGEYAQAGIPHYWIVRLDTTGVSIIERYRLDEVTRSYKHLGTLMKDEAGDSPEVTNPIPITVDWAQLEY
jgi:Uma2 family endonuclease